MAQKQSQPYTPAEVRSIKTYSQTFANSERQFKEQDKVLQEKVGKGFEW